MEMQQVLETKENTLISNSVVAGIYSVVGLLICLLVISVDALTHLKLSAKLCVTAN